MDKQWCQPAVGEAGLNSLAGSGGFPEGHPSYLKGPLHLKTNVDQAGRVLKALWQGLGRIRDCGKESLSIPGEQF